MRPGLTGSVEDYLKAIYDIAGERGSAPTSDIATRLNYAPPSVSGMVQRLAEQGYLEYERYRGVRLTQLGRKAAERIIRRHEVIEAYLVQVLDFPQAHAHDEAERLEHAASEELIDRMARRLAE